MNWTLDDEGKVIVCPVADYTIAVFYGQVIALRIDFARTRENLHAGRLEAEQFILGPDAALAIGKALVERAELVLHPTSKPQA